LMTTHRSVPTIASLRRFALELVVLLSIFGTTTWAFRGIGICSSISAVFLSLLSHFFCGCV
jgi:hypothetical protein